MHIYVSRPRKDIENRRQTFRIKLHCISMADGRGTRCICMPVLCPCTKTMYRVASREIATIEVIIEAAARSQEADHHSEMTNMSRIGINFLTNCVRNCICI